MICILPFGGYVRIAGMQQEGSREPYEISDGFYGKKPLAADQSRSGRASCQYRFRVRRIYSSLGGRRKIVSNLTNLQAASAGSIPNPLSISSACVLGDVIEQYDDRPFHGFKDLLVASLMDDKTTRIEGYKIDTLSGKKTDFDYTLKTYENPQMNKDKLLTIGVFSPASYLIYDGREADLLDRRSRERNRAGRPDPLGRWRDVLFRPAAQRAYKSIDRLSDRSKRR